MVGYCEAVFWINTRSTTWTVVLHLFLGLFLVCYARVILSRPTLIPPPLTTLDGHLLDTTLERKKDGTLRWCKKCEIMKPDRAHHCSICGICVLKMDHHCPWINNCVWFGNYRFFVQFLFYGFMYSLLMCIWSFQILFQTLDFHLLFVATLGLVFALALLSFLGLHLYYISTNQTTIESLEKRVLCLDECIYVTRRNIYNLGFIRNWQQVVGNAVVFYLLPVGTAMGNGLEFPINQQEIEKIILEC